MSETVNIAALAASASEKLFEVFGWELLSITDENFPCNKVEKHQTKGAGGVHPVDCVFSYSDPLSNRTIYLNCDLKSYAKSSIQTADFAPYIRSLSRAIDCAVSSTAWRDRYIEPNTVNWRIEGLLFVYNHDQGYDKKFKESARGLAPGSLAHSRQGRVHLLGPDDIAYLQSVVNDMKITCAEKNLQFQNRLFFYPQQILLPPGESLLPVATIEMLRGKLLITRFQNTLTKEVPFLVYLRSFGSLSDFEYIITYLYRKGVMSLASSVIIKGVSFLPEAQVNFENAKTQFLKRHYGMKEISDSLERIKFGRADQIVSNFSSIDESIRRSK